MIKDAYISYDGIYRYSLVRDWSDDDSYGMLFIMLNPSTADAVVDDPTIRRCMGFARREGCQYIEVVNLFAFRATDPKDMRSAVDPVGPDNDLVIRQAIADAEHVVCAWGVNGTFQGRDKKVLDIIRKSGHIPMCLGVTKDGHPKHPLYLSADSQLITVTKGI